MKKNIKTYRIGNDIQIKWPILTNGEEQLLDGRDLNLYVVDPMGNKKRIKAFGMEAHIIAFTFSHNEQKHTGVYGLMLVENEGKEHQGITDNCCAFQLVEKTCQIPDYMAEDTPLDAGKVDVGIHGLSAYEIAVNHGYEGSEEQWVHDFELVLNSTELSVEYSLQAVQVLARTEELFEGLSTIQETEQGRVSAEKGRVEDEEGRVEAEAGRVEAEQGRTEAETGRNNSEQERVESEA
ncbi:MAG: hypothetical protein IJ640_13335, partial [Prevotella sp.]|nr:hypothetical protein [Prevotella sp.]